MVFRFTPSDWLSFFSHAYFLWLPTSETWLLGLCRLRSEVGCVGFAKLRKATLPNFCVQGQHGVVDIMAQSMTVVQGEGRGFSLALPARIMSGKCANSVLESLESILNGSWALEQIKASGKQLILLVDVADSATANRKAMNFIGQSLAGSHVLYWPQRCGVHQSFRAVVRVLQRMDVMKKLFCLTNVLHVSSRQMSLRRAVAVIVERNIDYRVGLAPPPEDTPHRAHSRGVLKALLWRRRVRDEPGTLFARRDEEKLTERASLLTQVLQGKWWLPSITHYCVGHGCVRLLVPLNPAPIYRTSLCPALLSPFVMRLGCVTVVG
jgi:hypothetical protein